MHDATAMAMMTPMRAITLDGSVLAVDDNDGIAAVVPVVGPALVQPDPALRPSMPWDTCSDSRFDPRDGMIGVTLTRADGTLDTLADPTPEAIGAWIAANPGGSATYDRVLSDELVERIEAATISALSR